MNNNDGRSIPLGQLHVCMTGRTSQGTRQYQQDVFYIGQNKDVHLAVICDGMGGVEHGEIASIETVKMLSEDFMLYSLPEDPSLFLRKEIIDIDREISHLQDENGCPLDAGTTIVTVIAKDNLIWWLSVGDSRLFVARGNQFSAVTSEHNYRHRLDEWLRDGRLSEEEYIEESVHADALISYIGMGGLELIDQNVRPFMMQRFDRFLLCSDGLTRALGEERIRDILLKNEDDFQKAADELIQAAETCGKPHIDNTTLILVSYE